VREIVILTAILFGIPAVSATLICVLIDSTATVAFFISACAVSIAVINADLKLGGRSFYIYVPGLTVNFAVLVTLFTMKI
jgi:hypothetical protein